MKFLFLLNILVFLNFVTAADTNAQSYFSEFGPPDGLLSVGDVDETNIRSVKKAISFLEFNEREISNSIYHDSIYNIGTHSDETLEAIFDADALARDANEQLQKTRKAKNRLKRLLTKLKNGAKSCATGGANIASSTAAKLGGAFLIIFTEDFCNSASASEYRGAFRPPPLFPTINSFREEFSHFKTALNDAKQNLERVKRENWYQPPTSRVIQNAEEKGRRSATTFGGFILKK